MTKKHKKVFHTYTIPDVLFYIFTGIIASAITIWWTTRKKEIE